MAKKTWLIAIITSLSFTNQMLGGDSDNELNLAAAFRPSGNNPLSPVASRKTKKRSREVINPAGSPMSPLTIKTDGLKTIDSPKSSSDSQKARLTPPYPPIHYNPKGGISEDLTQIMEIATTIFRESPGEYCLQIFKSRGGKTGIIECNRKIMQELEKSDRYHLILTSNPSIREKIIVHDRTPEPPNETDQRILASLPKGKDSICSPVTAN